MDEAVIRYYRKLLRTRFEYAGSFENPSIFLDSVGEKVLICGSTGDFMHLYINIANNTINDIKYMCVCDPTANVAIEILCTLIKGKTLDKAASITEQAFYHFWEMKERHYKKCQVLIGTHKERNYPLPN